MASTLVEMGRMGPGSREKISLDPRKGTLRKERKN